jgi:hypothetical protein
MMASEFCLTPTDRKKVFARPRPPNWKRAYPAQPGTGPEGETCKTCEHLHRNRQAKVYLKCWKMQAVWTGGGGSDVKARAPACSRWQAKKPEADE